MPSLISGIGSVAAPIIGGLVGQAQSSGSRDQANQAAAQAYQIALGLGMPPDESKALVLQQFQSAGLMTPEMESTINAAPSQVAQIQTDPTARQAQVSALQQMQQVGNTGLNATDRAALNEARDEANQNTNSQMKSIMQGYAQKGQAGSGAQLAAQLAAAQGGANTLSQSDDTVAGQAASRALQAMSQANTAASNLNSQDFSQANTKAQAADELNRFNTQNAISTQQRNVASSNAAQAANLSNNQRLSDQNTQQYNSELQRQAQAAQQNWEDQLQRAGLQSGAALGNSNYLNGVANQTATSDANMGAGAGTALGALSKYYGSQGTGTTGSTTGSTSTSSPSEATGVDGSYTGNNYTLPDMGGGSSSSSGGGYGLGMAHGGMVPGRAMVRGDNPMNDKVHAMLSPGEIVIPREVAAHGPNAVFGFMHALLAKNKR